MTLVVPDVGEVEFLTRILNKGATGDVKLHLNTSNTTPAEGDTVATYTEATGTGYGAITLTGASWSIGTVGGTTTASYAQQTFTMTTQETYYGYYVTNSAGTVLMWSEKFTDGPYTTGTSGGTVKVTPSIQMA